MTSPTADPRPRVSVADAQHADAQATAAARGLALMVADTLRAMYADAVYLVFYRDDYDRPELAGIRDVEGKTVCDLTADRIPTALNDDALRAAWGSLDPQNPKDLQHLVALMDSLGGEFDDLPDELGIYGDAESTQCLPLSRHATLGGPRTPGPRHLRPYGAHHSDTTGTICPPHPPRRPRGLNAPL
ncbi:hypothetical protein [Streptomyces olivoreticuli]|uniref:hypothetical protein n=1 Tax=Streptomyces olivoreticuli TaxID=68246 RepID=UPI000E229D57|nr:hypothetical protein [Streptomyces olivoreticuli]